MSKLDREIRAIIDDMGAQANALVPKVVAIIADDGLSEDGIIAKVAELMEAAQPKTYDTYIADLKQVFKEAGWIAPEVKS